MAAEAVVVAAAAVAEVGAVADAASPAVVEVVAEVVVGDGRCPIVHRPPIDLRRDLRQGVEVAEEVTGSQVIGRRSVICRTQVGLATVFRDVPVRVVNAPVQVANVRVQVANAPVQAANVRVQAALHRVAI